MSAIMILKNLKHSGKLDTISIGNILKNQNVKYLFLMDTHFFKVAAIIGVTPIVYVLTLPVAGSQMGQGWRGGGC
jgi:hypothetical protein